MDPRQIDLGDINCALLSTHLSYEMRLNCPTNQSEAALDWSCFDFYVPRSSHGCTRGVWDRLRENDVDSPADAALDEETEHSAYGCPFLSSSLSGVGYVQGTPVLVT
jgi:hypothetical protein